MAINITPRQAPPSSGGRGDWMQTYLGGQFFPLDPRPEEVHIEDIAHALGMLCRYNGHVSRFYSVAEHCVLMSYAIPPEYALTALMHDASEAYLGDMIRPLKRTMSEYLIAEAKVTKAIAEAFHIDAWLPVLVKEYDTRILVDERLELMQPPPAPWFGNEQVAPLGVAIEGWRPAIAERRFHQRFYDLITRTE